MCLGSISCCDQLYSVWRLSSYQWCGCLLLRVGQLYSLVSVFVPWEKSWVQGEEMCGYVCGCARTHSTKSETGPCWCGTKCHSLIRINSPIWALGLGTNAQQGEHECVVTHCFCSLSLSLSLSARTHIHTHTLGHSGFTSLWPTPGVFGQMWSLNNKQKAVTASGHELYTSLWLHLTHTHFHSHTYILPSLNLCICSICWHDGSHWLGTLTAR